MATPGEDQQAAAPLFFFSGFLGDLAFSPSSDGGIFGPSPELSSCGSLEALQRWRLDACF